MLVILAVVRERYLHTATNYFITSLAVADCLVGLVVMPFSALYEVLEHTWFFGPDWCDVWRSLDVLFSTASILNLCVISLDRYWAITDPITYPMRMTRLRSMLLIAAVWVCSSAISFPAIAWWRAVRTEPIPEYKCPFTEHLGYLIFSSTISFYLPLFVMVFTYYRIYRAAVAQTKSLRLGTKQVLLGAGELELTLRIHRGGTGKVSTSDTRNLYASQEDEPLTALQNNGLARMASTRIGPQNKNFSLSRKLAKFAKEKKAAKTLEINRCFYEISPEYLFKPRKRYNWCQVRGLAIFVDVTIVKMATKGNRLKDLKVVDLKRELEERDQETSGKKNELQERLSKVMSENGEDPDTYEFEVDGSMNDLKKVLKEEMAANSKSLKEEMVENSRSLK
ncbi:adrenergic receptor-related g-protein coupled receptor [Holotrichia oblita]|uniref:Adrenergic receptor-related g-protein coupled receptor n=1 Tax=Holotrichia oblita TaxID=644536 RepID=A0ACB9SU23_HOLOL|nr:adrenergic receptor-related g-protein coupled receptor [Holotrichia oblita]